MQLLINVLQNRYYYKFPKIHKKISVLEPLFVEVTGLMDCNFIKKETPTRFSMNVTKSLRKALFMEHIQWLFLKMVEEFLGISKSSLTGMICMI